MAVAVRPSFSRRYPPRRSMVEGLSLEKKSATAGDSKELLTRGHANGPEHIVPVGQHACNCCSTNAESGYGHIIASAAGHAKPSVPSRSVANFSSSATICVASAPLSSFNCLRFSSSDLLAAIRAARADDCCAFWELGCRNEEPVVAPDGNAAVGRGAYAMFITCHPVRKERVATVEFR